jgi:hypothetical protein
MLCTFVCSAALAQNVKRLEEEALLDQEKKRRVEELLKARQAEEERIKSMDLSDKELEAQQLVEVEPNNILPSDLSAIYVMVPYKIRRPAWGGSFGINYVMMTPSKYASDFASPALIDFETLYGDGGLIELSYAHKFNFVLGSIGFEGGYGFYSNSADDTSFGELDLSLQQARVGIRYVVDAIAYEPVVAPYLGAGAYVTFYKESLGADSFNGQTDPALYYYAGLLFQLNWIDKGAAVEAYTEGGIENTFFFIEGRQYMASSTAQDPDFSTDISVSGGLNLEF